MDGGGMSVNSRNPLEEFLKYGLQSCIRKDPQTLNCRQC